MNNMPNPIETLFERAEDYSKTTLELLRLNTIDKSADVASSLAVRFVLVTVIALFTLVMNIGVALWIGELLSKPYYGFFAVGIFYVIVAVVIYIFRQAWIKTPTSNSIITLMMKQKMK